MTHTKPLLLAASALALLTLTGCAVWRLAQAVELARQTAPFVVLMPAGNVGNAPFFFPPVSWWMTQRARRLHAAVAASAERHGAVYVRLFEERENDPFARQRALNASDGLHPSDEGYRVWLKQLLRQGGLVQRFARLQESP